MTENLLEKITNTLNKEYEDDISVELASDMARITYIDNIKNELYESVQKFKSQNIRDIGYINSESDNKIILKDNPVDPRTHIQYIIDKMQLDTSEDKIDDISRLVSGVNESDEDIKGDSFDLALSGIMVMEDIRFLKLYEKLNLSEDKEQMRDRINSINNVITVDSNSSKDNNFI